MAISEIIVSYITANRSKGKKDATIISELKKAGWNQDYIDSALNLVDKQKQSGIKPLTYTTAIIASVLLIGGGLFYAISNRNSILINASIEEASQVTTDATRTVSGQLTPVNHSSILSASSNVDGPIIINEDGSFTIEVYADKPDKITIYDIDNGIITNSAITIPGTDTIDINTTSTAIAAIFSKYDQATIESIGAVRLHNNISTAKCTLDIVARLNKNLASASYDQILSDVLIQGQIEDCSNQALGN